MSSRARIAVAIGFLALLAYIVYSTFTLGRFRCEVCIEFRGREVCRTARGASEEEAIRTAIDNACAQVARGRTESILCGQTRPRSIDCGGAEAAR